MLGALVLAFAVPATAGDPRPPARRRGAVAVSPGTLEREVMTLVNGHRAARGLAPLVVDVRVTGEARRHSEAMAMGSTPFGHRGFDDRVAALHGVMRFRRSAENVAVNRGYADPAAQAVEGWLASRGHRENIEGSYELTGVGVASSAAGDVFFTQLFVGR